MTIGSIVQLCDPGPGRSVREMAELVRENRQAVAVVMELRADRKRLKAALRDAMPLIAVGTAALGGHEVVEYRGVFTSKGRENCSCGACSHYRHCKQLLAELEAR